MSDSLPTIDTDLKSALVREQKLFSGSQVSIATVSATYRKELLKKYRVFSALTSEAIYSRAHYSMAEAVRQQALRHRLSTHMVDPLNFVATNDWSKVDFTEFVGQLLARNQFLKTIKDKIDSKVRNKLPFTEAITPVLEYVSATTTNHIISMHYEAGNILAHFGHKILQVVTDPHVRPQYLDALPTISANSNQIPSQITFAVFDSATKKDLLKLAGKLDKQINSKDVIVTGPPVDPRIAKLAKGKKIIDPNQPIHIGITTGGLGTNLNEIRKLLDNLGPVLKHYPERIRLFLYAGTHKDFRAVYEKFALDNNLRVGNIDDTKARCRILYEDSIIDANENLIKYMFPWAHGIISKPSGDMAYEAVAAGCFLLCLEPWGDWEVNIQKRLIKKGAALNLNSQKAHKSFTYFLQNNHFKKAQTKAINLPDSYRTGAKKIIMLHTQLRNQSS